MHSEFEIFEWIETICMPMRCEGHVVPFLASSSNDWFAGGIEWERERGREQRKDYDTRLLGYYD